MDWPTIVVALLICGSISAAIGTSKNHNGLQSFLAGALLGIIGIAIVAAAPRRNAQPLAGPQGTEDMDEWVRRMRREQGGP